MEPKAAGILDIALWDPVAAYGILLGADRIPIQMNVPAIFNSFSTSQIPVEGDLDQTISQKTWISRIDYSLQLPNVFSGNVFKTLSDAMLRIGNPGVSVRVSVYGGPKYMPAPNFTPLENFTNVVSDMWPAGWPLHTNQSIKCEYILTQSPPSTSPNGPPYIVIVTFTGWQFLDPTVAELPVDEARERLARMGIQTINPPVRA
jgi:hypothetical protein